MKVKSAILFSTSLMTLSRPLFRNIPELVRTLNPRWPIVLFVITVTIEKFKKRLENVKFCCKWLYFREGDNSKVETLTYCPCFFLFCYQPQSTSPCKASQDLSCTHILPWTARDRTYRQCIQLNIPVPQKRLKKTMPFQSEMRRNSVGPWRWAEQKDRI